MIKYLNFKLVYFFETRFLFSTARFFAMLFTKKEYIMKTYGYARVSAKDQNLARQLDSFKRFGIPQQNIYAEKSSGKDFCRTEYLKLRGILQKDDLLVIQSLDRLGRNYDQITEEWRKITQSIGANILVLDMPLLDTRSRLDTLLGKFVSNLVLEVLSFVAENERSNIRARQAEGIRIAKERGVKFGRPKIVLYEQFIFVAKKYIEKEITLYDALSTLKISRSSFYRRLSLIKKL